MLNSQLLYYSTLAACALLGMLSTSFFLHFIAWVVAMSVALGKVVFENMCSYR